jgi:hypothetical protein
MIFNGVNIRFTNNVSTYGLGTYDSEPLLAFWLLYELSLDTHWDTKPVFTLLNERYHVLNKFAAG